MTSKQSAIDPKLDFAIERLIDAPARLVWDALTNRSIPRSGTCPRLGGVCRGSHRSEADLAKNRESGFYQGTEIAIDRLVAHAIALK